MGGHSGCQIQVFWGGDRGGNGGGMVTGSTGGYWWLCSGHWQWVPCMSEGGRERRGKAGGAEERPVGTETEELDHEDSVGPWPLFPLRKREIRRGSEKRTEWAVTRGECKSLSSGEATTRPSAAARTGRKTGVCGGQILWWGEWDSAAPVGLVLGLHGGEMEGLIRRESLGVGGDAPQGLGATQSYSEVPEVKHNKNCTSKTTSSSSGPAQYTLPATLAHFLFIFMFYIQMWQHMQHSVTQSTACGST